MKTNHLVWLGIIPLILITSSCKEIMMMRYGIHQPREETPESIFSFMEKMDYPNENTFVFKDSSAFYACLRDSVFRNNALGTLFFSPQGLLDNYKDTSRCQWPGGYFIRNLKHDTIYHADTGYTLQKLMDYTIPLNESTKRDTANADYIVVISWATFLGKYNERLFSIRSAISENKEVKVSPVFLCIDMLKEWRMTKREAAVLQFE